MLGSIRQSTFCGYVNRQAMKKQNQFWTKLATTGHSYIAPCCRPSPIRPGVFRRVAHPFAPFAKGWGRFSLACLCVPPEFRRAAQSSISTSSRRGALGLGGVRERLRFGGGGFGDDLILVGFAVDAKLHFVFVEGEFNRGMDGNDDGVGGLHLPDVVVGGDGADDVFLAKDRDGHFLLHLGAAGHGIFGDDRAQLGFVASLDDHRSGQDDGGEEEWFLHECLLESVDSPVASSVREPVGGKLVRGCSGALKVNAKKEASNVGTDGKFPPF